MTLCAEARGGSGEMVSPPRAEIRRGANDAAERRVGRSSHARTCSGVPVRRRRRFELKLSSVCQRCERKFLMWCACDIRTDRHVSVRWPASLDFVSRQ